MKYILTALLAFYATSTLAAPIGVICADSRGQITIVQKCAKSQTKISTQNLSAFGLQGPQGIQGDRGFQGPQGAQGFQGSQGLAGANGFNGTNGTVDIAKCHIRENTSTGSNAVIVSASCLVGEFMANQGCYFTNAAPGTFPVSAGIFLQNAPNSVIGNQVYQVSSCVFKDIFLSGGSFAVTAQAWCCFP